MNGEISLISLPDRRCSRFRPPKKKGKSSSMRTAESLWPVPGTSKAAVNVPCPPGRRYLLVQDHWPEWARGMSRFVRDRKLACNSD